MTEVSLAKQYLGKQINLKVPCLFLDNWNLCSRPVVVMGLVHYVAHNR